jgi:hypothetical protein
MAVDYNILRPDGPTNLYAGFATGQQVAAQNALAQQKLAQERDLMSMRRQEFQANLEASQAERRRKAQVEKTAMFRERVLRAPTPQAARELVRLQHSDPDLGPVMQQFGSLDQDLADIPDDPAGFENWRQREAMGAAEFIKKNAARQRRQDILSQLGEGQPPVEPAAAPVAAAAPAAEPSVAGALTNLGRTPPKYSKSIFGTLPGSSEEILNSNPEAKRLYELYSMNMSLALNSDPDSREYTEGGRLASEQAKQLSELGIKLPENIGQAREVLGIRQPASAAANALAPTPAPTTNAMLATAAPAAAAPPAALAAAQRPATGRTPERIAREIDLLSQEDDPALKGRIARLMKEYEAALKPAAAKPDTVPASVREVQAYLQMTPEERAVFEKLQKIKGTNVTATATATSPTGKSLAGPVGARAEASLVKAEGAAGIMENANMVREALNTGNVIAGPLAGVRTKFAQILELAGAGDKEKLVNTRNTIQGLASLTLESRAELKGQGQVTDTETKLLERARSADINELTIAELQQVVNVSQRLANRMWSNHQSLLKTMEGDPAATDSIRYYRPTMSLPQAIGEGRPATPAQTDKRKQGLDAIFGGGR